MLNVAMQVPAPVADSGLAVLALVRWLRWGWEHVSEGGFWMPKRLQVPDKPVKRSEPSDTQ